MAAKKERRLVELGGRLWGGEVDFFGVVFFGVDFFRVTQHTLPAETVIIAPFADEVLSEWSTVEGKFYGAGHGLVGTIEGVVFAAIVVVGVF